MVNPKPISRGRVRVDFTRRPTLACSGQPDQRSPVLLAPRRRAADAGRWTKPLRGRFHEVSIGNCQQRTGPCATGLNTSRSFI
jgi:hypothetical protein